MKYLFTLLLSLTIISCQSDDGRSNPANFNVNTTINLNLPQYTNLLISGGFAYAISPGNTQGILILNSGLGSNPYKAWERTCPYLECSTPMTFDGSLKQTCCNDHQFSILDGSELPTATDKFAYEYRVLKLSDTSLRITNF